MTKQQQQPDNDPFLKIRLDGRVLRIRRSAYVAARRRTLLESYPDLTEAEIEHQLDRLLSGKQWTDVVGAVIEGDLVLDDKDRQ